MFLFYSLKAVHTAETKGSIPVPPTKITCLASPDSLAGGDNCKQFGLEASL